MFVENPVQTSELATGYAGTLSLPYINISLNPFIYAAKHEGVRRILLARMIICRKRDDVAAVEGTSRSYRNTGGSGTNKITKINVVPK